MESLQLQTDQNATKASRLYDLRATEIGTALWSLFSGAFLFSRRAPSKCFTVVIVAFGMLSVCSSVLYASDPILHFDGVYRVTKVKDGVTYFKYLQFFPDGAVIGASTVASRSQMQWFARGDPHVASGRYSVEGTHIQFALKSESGTVRYKGDIDTANITVSSLSEINGHSGVETYEYVPDTTTHMPGATSPTRKRANNRIGTPLARAI